MSNLAHIQPGEAANADSVVALHKCGACKQTKPAEDFQKNTSRKSGVQAWCKECQNGHIDTVQRHQHMAVYLMTNTKTGDRYVGSTTKSLEQRLWDHKAAARRGATSELYCCMRAFSDDDDWTIQPLEIHSYGAMEIPELRSREQYHIDLLDPELNMHAAIKECA